MTAQGTLVLTRREITGLMTFQDYVWAVEEAFKLAAEGKMLLPGVVDLPARDGVFHIKTAALPKERFYVASKLNANFPLNPSRHQLPTIQGVIALFDGENGAPLAILDSIEVTIQRTGAATVLAARHLARADSQVATVCGCGRQGRIQLIALKHVLPLEHAYAFDLNPQAARDFAAQMESELGIPVTSVAELAEATRHSQVIVTCTTAREPILHPHHVHPGTFVAAVGADSHDKQELAPEIFKGATIVVDRLAQCATIGDLHHALEQGVVTKTEVHAELGEILAGHKPGRTSPQEIIVFDSTGVAFQDVAAAAAIYERAQAAGIGHRFDLGA